MQKMQQHQVRLISMGGGKLRLVTHMDYTQRMHERFLDILDRL
jgi:threonine aldolase